MEYTNLLKILNGDLSRIDLVNKNDIASYETEVTVMPNHVRKMLQDFLSGNITSQDLTKWALFICIRAEYCCINPLDDKVADYYEDMFYVIQRLSTPEIDGEVNSSRVKSYLIELKKYPE